MGAAYHGLAVAGIAHGPPVTARDSGCDDGNRADRESPHRKAEFTLLVGEIRLGLGGESLPSFAVHYCGGVKRLDGAGHQFGRRTAPAEDPPLTLSTMQADRATLGTHGGMAVPHLAGDNRSLNRQRRAWLVRA